MASQLGDYFRAHWFPFTVSNHPLSLLCVCVLMCRSLDTYQTLCHKGTRSKASTTFLTSNSPDVAACHRVEQSTPKLCSNVLLNPSPCAQQRRKFGRGVAAVGLWARTKPTQLGFVSAVEGCERAKRCAGGGNARAAKVCV